MDHKEKVQFLKQMGLSYSQSNIKEPTKKAKDKQDNQVDKEELISLARTFNVYPK